MKLPKWVPNNSTSILSGLAVTGVVATVALAVRATPNAMKKIDDLKDEKWAEVETLAEGRDENAVKPDLTPVEIIKVTWLDYLPAGIAGVATVGCIIGANKIGLRRNAAMLGAYTLVDGAFREYKDEVLKVIGSKKEQEVRDSVSEKHVADNPPKVTEVIITGGGDQLCYDSLTGRYFKSDIEAIRRAENEIDHRILNDMYATQNDFYELIGLPSCTLGELLGWCIENRLKLIFTSALSDVGVPCLAIEYEQYPRVGYDKF